MDGFKEVIKEISLMLQKTDPDIIWYFESGLLKERMRFELEGQCFLYVQSQNKKIRCCCEKEDCTIKITEQHAVWGKKHNTKEEELELDIARDFILKKVKVIMEMIAFFHSKGQNEVLLEWSFLPTKTICPKVASLLPVLLYKEGLEFKVNAECIENGDGILLSW